MKDIEKELVKLFKDNKDFSNIRYGADSEDILVAFNYKDLVFRLEYLLFAGSMRLLSIKLIKRSSLDSRWEIGSEYGSCLIYDLDKESKLDCIISRVDLVYEFYKYLERNPNSDPMTIDIFGDFLKTSDIIIKKNYIIKFLVSKSSTNPAICFTASKGEVFTLGLRCRVDVELCISKPVGRDIEVEGIMKLSFEHGSSSFKPASNFLDFLSDPETFFTAKVPGLNLDDIESSRGHLIKAIQVYLLTIAMNTSDLETCSIYQELVDKIQVELYKYE